MGWVESCLGCSAIMPSCSAIYAQFPSAKADDRTTNIKVNPTKLCEQMELPVYIKEISRSEQRGWATKSNTGSINNELKPPISSLIIIRQGKERKETHSQPARENPTTRHVYLLFCLHVITLLTYPTRRVFFTDVFATRQLRGLKISSKRWGKTQSNFKAVH